MGFFSDLKEDVSQAATELMGEEGKAPAETAEAPAETDEAETAAIDMDALLAKAEENVARVEAEDKKTKASGETAVITEGMSVNGNITSAGSIDLFGSVIGNIALNGKLYVVGSVEGDSKAAEIFCDGAKITGEVNSLGTVKVGKDSVIVGNIFATSAVLAGAVKGDIDVKGPVILDSSAIVMGNIKSKSLQINNGAVIEGICSQCYAEISPTSFFDNLGKKKK